MTAAALTPMGTTAATTAAATDERMTGAQVASSLMGGTQLMPSSSPTDLELVRGLHARDPRSFTRVYGDHHAGVYNLCARILGDREEAKDMTQDVFLKAFSKPPAATDDVRLRAWLYRVATNACLNLIRGRRTDGAIEAETMAATGDPFEQAQTASLIELSLAGMNERYRAALVLKDLHGLEGRELAQVLEVSRPTADVLVHRARASFRRAFAGLAGKDATAPANLAVALPMLAVPAALQTLPLLPAHAPGSLSAPAPGIPPGVGPIMAAPAAGSGAGAGPAVGLIAKIGAALGTKAAVVAAGAALVAGGSIAAVEFAGTGVAPAPASTGGVSVSAGHGREGGQSGEHDGGGWARHRSLIADHLDDAHHAGEGAHHTAGAHDTAHDNGSGSHHTGGSDHAISTSQESTTHESTAATSGSSGTTSGTATHDGGDGGHDDGGEH